MDNCRNSSLHVEKKQKITADSPLVSCDVQSYECYDSQSVSFEMNEIEITEPPIEEIDQSVQSIGSIDSDHSASEQSESWSSDDECDKEIHQIPEHLGKEKLDFTEAAFTNKGEFLYNDFAFFRSEHSQYLDNNQLYFYEQYRAKALDGNDGTGGYRSLCQRAFEGRNLTDASNLAPHRVSELMFRLNSVLIGTQGSNAIEVMALVECICNQFQHNIYEQFGEESIEIVPKKFPQTYKDARRIILDGRHSVMENFPSPKVFVIGQHACVSLKETIQHMAGHGATFDFAWNGHTQKRSTDGLNGTVAAGKVVLDVMSSVKLNNGDESTNIGTLSFWSDSYLQSFIKQKDSSVWLLTVTISPPKEDISKGTYTQVLAIGKKGQDHTDVIDHYMKEAEELKKGFDCYFACSNRIERMACGLMYWSSDRPERQSIMQTLGEGTYGIVTGYSVEVCDEKLPACKECFLRIIRNVNNSKCEPHHCKRCFCWNIDPKDPDQEVTRVPVHYPSRTHLEDENGSTILEPEGRETGRETLGPVKLSSSWLIAACSFAYEARRRNRWNKKEFHTYLRTCCVCEFRRNIIETQALRDRQNNTRSQPEIYLPAVWLACNIFDLFFFPDMPMHALAHGIGDDVIHFIHSILTEFKQGNTYGVFANGIISEIEAFNLDWCKLKSYPKSAWVGENIMAYLRISSYLYGMFMVTKPFFGEYEQLMNSTKRLINALQTMLSILMSSNPKVYQQYDLLREKVKLFLTTAHYCEQEFAPTFQHRQKTGSNKKDGPIDDLSNSEVGYLLYKLEIESSSDPRKSLEKISAKKLQAYLHSMGISWSGRTNKKKKDLQLILFASLLGREINWPCISNQDSSLSEVRLLSFIWKKGAWLSFVTNISEQIRIMGPLIWIW